MTEQNTRDTAVRAETKVDAHITDCQQFRLIIDKRLSEFRDDIRKLNWRVALITGVGIAVQKGMDLFFNVPHH